MYAMLVLLNVVVVVVSLAPFQRREPPQHSTRHVGCKPSQSAACGHCCVNLPGVFDDFFFRYFAHSGGRPRAPVPIILRRDAGSARFRRIFASGERLL